MKKWYHLVFLAICVGVLLILLNAPEVSTPRLPRDADHRDRRDYPACPGCHGATSAAPMPEDHLDSGESLRPDHEKCYFCHKPQEE